MGSNHVNVHGPIGNYLHRKREIKTKRTPRQGSVLSPLLFIFYIDTLIEALAKSGTGIQTPNMDHPLPCLMFVDDLEIFSKSMKDFRIQQNIINQFADDWDLIINKSKTHIMCTKKSEPLNRWCRQQELKYEPSKHNRYLGVEVNPTGPTGKSTYQPE